MTHLKFITTIILWVIIVWVFFKILYEFIRVVCKPLVSAHPNFFFRWGLTSCQKFYANTTNPQWIDTDSHPYCSDCQEIITVKESTDSYIITNKDLIFFDVILGLKFEKIPGGRKATVITKRTIPFLIFCFLLFCGIFLGLLSLTPHFFFHIAISIIFFFGTLLAVFYLMVIKEVFDRDKAAVTAVVNKFIEEYGDTSDVRDKEKKGKTKIGFFQRNKTKD